MANSTAKAVMRLAILQRGYCEKPAGSNRTKFGAYIGANGQPWCASYEYWCGDKAVGANPIGRSASAAYIQEATVAKGGKWVMRKTSSKAARKEGQVKAKFGDIVSFDFGKFNCWRAHTAFVIGRSGSDYICIEGNTSPSERGSQNNGGCVAIRRRKYTDVCSIVRPNYGKQEEHKITKPYTGDIPKIPGRGYFNRKDKGSNVKALQKSIKWASGADIEIDGEFGNETLFGVIWFQTMYGLTPDGEFGSASLKKLKALIEKHRPKGTLQIIGKVEAPTTKSAPKKRTKAQKLNDYAIADAYKYKTNKRKYRYPSGKPKDHYKKDLNKAYPHRENWWKQTRAGAACDVYVPVVIRASGIDKKIPHGLEYMNPYLEKSKKFKRVKSKKGSKGRYFSANMLKGGDFVVLKYKGGGGHTFFIVEKNGKKYIAEANFHGKAYPHISKPFKKMYKKNYKMLRVYRVKE